MQAGAVKDLARACGFDLCGIAAAIPGEEDARLHARSRVVALLGRLNPRYATAIRLRVLEERSREEAAKELEVSVATFDVVLHRAMAALKKALASETGGS